MKNLLLSSCLLGVFCLPINSAIFAQSNEDDEIFVLSPFEVDGGGNYRGYGRSLVKEVLVDSLELGLAAAELRDPLMQVYPSSGSAPVRIVRPLDELSMRFAYAYYHDEESERRQVLEELLNSVEDSVRSVGSVRFNPERIVIKKGDRTRALRKRRAEYTSHAYFSLVVILEDGLSPSDAIQHVRSLVESVEVEDEFTRLFHGEVDWVFRMKSEYRDDLLSRIFADLHLQRENYGPDFEVSITQLNIPLQAKLFSENEVEIWIPYNYQISSNRERELKLAEKWARLGKG